MNRTRRGRARQYEAPDTRYFEAREQWRVLASYCASWCSWTVGSIGALVYVAFRVWVRANCPLLSPKRPQAPGKLSCISARVIFVGQSSKTSIYSTIMIVPPYGLLTLIERYFVHIDKRLQTMYIFSTVNLSVRF